MKALFLSAAVVALLAVPAAAQTLSYGATLTSNYVSRGFTQTNDGWALQPWVEIESSGWYGGLWASNVDFGADSVEVDIYGGYRWSRENTSFDLGYARYFYDDSGDAGGELYVLIEHEIGQATLSGGMHMGHAGGLTMNNAYVGFALAMTDQISVSAQGGVAGGLLYGNLGASYAVTDAVSLDARYHLGNGINTRAVISASIGF
ncbi:MAG: TorF family putative porin [Rhodobacteraceae bacterium]|jgi:uncharacterized protein (TIGR02001 family)|nr:TorF family putative porin [Paracoccaceae bacterium]